MNDKNIKEINKTTDLISSLIHEYLFKKEYFKTLDIFQQELSNKIRSGQFYSILRNNEEAFDFPSLLNYFELGNKYKFLENWKRIIPNNLKLTEPTLIKLDFNIQIYFAIYPLLKPNININDIIIQKNLKKNMEEFKLYLEQNNIEQFKSPEFLSYYALPYVQDPRKNQSYSNLFSPEWKKCLKEQIQRCLDYYSPNNFNKFPILYDLTRGKKIITLNNNIADDLKNDNNRNEDKTLKELIKENKLINEENRKLRVKDEKNKKMFIDAQKTWCNLGIDIINYSFDLLDIYNKEPNHSKNSSIDEINNKLLKYQNFFIKNLEELEKSNKNVNDIINILNIKKFNAEDNLKYDSNTIKNYIPKQQNDYIMNINQKNNNNNIISMNALNIENNNLEHYAINNINDNMKNKLKNQNRKIKSKFTNKLINMNKLVQAINHQIYIEDKKLEHVFYEIRSRIFNKENKELRLITLYEIFFYDILGTLSNASNIFKQLISNKNLNLEVMKLVNGLANFNKGKNYLLSKNTLIEDIVKCMIGESKDSELRQNCLGAIQKFSLRNEPQNKLIELNIIHYLVDIFSLKSESLSDYTIEYGLALLMNLSLRKEGKEKFEAVAEKVINILLKFLNCENVQILTCINGMIYSLLKKRKIRELAIIYGIEKKLSELKKFNDEQINKQVNYIIDELNNYSNENNDYLDDNKEDTFAEEDINAKDNLEEIYNEYPEIKTINDKYMEQHYKILSEFFIFEPELESTEKQKIEIFMNENENMTKGLLVCNNRSHDSSLRKEDNNNENEEEIINTNINDNNNVENQYNNNDVIKNNYDIIHENNNDYDDIYGKPDDGFAFKTQDKIKRTPPRQPKNHIF